MESLNPAQTKQDAKAPLIDPLLDVQGLGDQRGVAIQQVGVKEVSMPMNVLQKDGHLQSVAAKARLSVGLPGHFKGTHMSRFIIQLTEWSRDKVLSLNLKEFLAETCERLAVDAAQTDIRFSYFMDKAAPVSKLAAPMSYDCSFRGSLTDGEYRLVLGLVIPICTLCPCSKAISDYGAHNQRAEIHVQVDIDTQVEHPVVWIEDLVTALEACASCPVYPLVKREDEKWMTERAYDNPKFVEDVIRDGIIVLRNYPGITGFSIEVNALESIHGHNAWAQHSENFSECVNA
jgi:GTP cyclohydrolase I